MSTPLRALSCLLLTGCAPDRLYVEGSHGWGTIDPSDKLGQYDTEGDAVTVGLSWPLGAPQERVVVERYVISPPAPASPSGAPIASTPLPTDDDSEIPWTEIMFMAAGALGMETSRRSVPAIRKRLKKQTLVT